MQKTFLGKRFSAQSLLGIDKLRCGVPFKGVWELGTRKCCFYDLISRRRSKLSDRDAYCKGCILESCVFCGITVSTFSQNMRIISGVK